MNEFAALQSEVKAGTPGWWDDVLPKLDERQYADLMEAAGMSEISHRTIAKVMGRWGFEVTVAQVGHWRRNHVG